MTLVRCYPIGVMKMTDGGAGDEKVIAIPWADPTYEAYTDISELPKHILTRSGISSVYIKIWKEKDCSERVRGRAWSCAGH